MDQKKRTEIASLGQFGLIDLLTSGFTPKNASVNGTGTMEEVFSRIAAVIEGLK